jgi:hypothetical protein
MDIEVVSAKISRKEQIHITVSTIYKIYGFGEYEYPKDKLYTRDGQIGYYESRYHNDFIFHPVADATDFNLHALEVIESIKYWSP